MLIELKNGDTYNGRLVNCNIFMNISLRDVICTSKDGDRFWKIPECYIRGNSIKYLRIPDEVISMVPEEEHRESKWLPRHIIYLKIKNTIKRLLWDVDVVREAPVGYREVGDEKVNEVAEDLKEVADVEWTPEVGESLRVRIYAQLHQRMK